ncbi:hypothetical protein AB0J80_33275 [Actinoplanes sp. NPDC049548]|uniref:hypothetical protein n=1 Tax=Actinoplanes sp. NPDC049548 TaxID=3155152 RepID=UPI00343DB900
MRTLSLAAAAAVVVVALLGGCSEVEDAPRPVAFLVEQPGEVAAAAYDVGELRAQVHYPPTITGRLPLFLQVDGYDEQSGAALVARGFVVVSISAAAGDRDRLVDAHLALWRQLADGGGPLAVVLRPLAGHVDAGTVDMTSTVRVVAPSR